MATTATHARAATTILHRAGCPVADHPEDAALAARVETYRAVRPGKNEHRDGVLYAIPPEPLRVTHCQECGELTYTKETHHG